MDILAKDPETKAQLVVVYNIQEGTDYNSLNVRISSSTWFDEEATEEIKQVLNIAARMLVDRENTELIYSSLVNNMLYVPSQLRKNPN